MRVIERATQNMVGSAYFSIPSSIPDDILKIAFERTIYTMGQDPYVRDNQAGATLIATLINPRLKIYPPSENSITASIGDSSAFLFTWDEDEKKWSCQRVNAHHNLQNKKERKRLAPWVENYQCAIKDGCLCLQSRAGIFIRMEKSGLNITRALGDQRYQRAGLISDPDYYRSDFDPATQFILLTTNIIDCPAAFLDEKERLDLIIKYLEHLANQHFSSGPSAVDEVGPKMLGALKKDIKVRLWGDVRYAPYVDDATHMLLVRGNQPAVAVVLDGHGGSEVSDYVAKQFPSVFYQTLISCFQELNGSFLEKEHDDVDALIHSFCKNVDESGLSFNEANEIEFLKVAREYVRLMERWDKVEKALREYEPTRGYRFFKGARKKECCQSALGSLDELKRSIELLMIQSFGGNNRSFHAYLEALNGLIEEALGCIFTKVKPFSKEGTKFSRVVAAFSAR